MAKSAPSNQIVLEGLERVSCEGQQTSDASSHVAVARKKRDVKKTGALKERPLARMAEEIAKCKADVDRLKDDIAKDPNTLLKLLAGQLKQVVSDNEGITQATGGLVRVFLRPDKSGPFKLYASIKGPPDSPYSDGTFLLSLQMDEKYPFTPPIVKFETSIWHPNVRSEDGLVSLDFLMSTTGNWSPAWKLNSILLAVFSTMTDPVVNDVGSVVNQEAAEAYQTNQEHYWKMAQYHTSISACGDTLQSSMVQCLVGMGFEEDLAKRMLKKKNWNPDEAALALLQRREARYKPIAANDKALKVPQRSSSFNEEDDEDDGSSSAADSHSWFDVCSTILEEDFSTVSESEVSGN